MKLASTAGKTSRKITIFSPTSASPTSSPSSWSRKTTISTSSSPPAAIRCMKSATTSMWQIKPKKKSARIVRKERTFACKISRMLVICHRSRGRILFLYSSTVSALLWWRSTLNYGVFMNNFTRSSIKATSSAPLSPHLQEKSSIMVCTTSNHSKNFRCLHIKPPLRSFRLQRNRISRIHLRSLKRTRLKALTYWQHLNLTLIRSSGISYLTNSKQDKYH